ncbi:hypothetical protein FHS83_002881 [Rhizomicrobium palustre]|uniref:Uncharacterized protein n=1 Tax=Rhizomicrobium palustre TaxID=189966 RepID=A0A846N1T0_9PROT|nr:hypothetical protein [Rhizomicrobium palustre]NIK89563.1 hypothetical protein [Rhizomicrobium palustre]
MRGWVGLLFGACLILSAGHAEGIWRITKDHWSEADEAGFSRFVQAIGESNCSSSQSCLRDPANPFRDSDKHFLDIDTDCAKWAYLLRGYYAWKNGLPFSFVDGVTGAGDEKHSSAGNRPTSRRAFVDHGEGIGGASAVRELISSVFSANFRTDAARGDGVLADFYAPRIAPGVIRPGTVIYDTNAHVGIVYKVDPDGRIYYMDAHPDFTITRSVYGAQFGQSPAKLGGGLKNWRPLKLVGAQDDGKGHLIGGRIVAAKNGEIADFSLEQYSGTEPHSKKPRFIWDGEEMGFYAYVRTAMSGGKTPFNPLHELRVTLRGLCSDLKDRAATVDLAISQRVQEAPHPARLPSNIFDSGDAAWEQYATPARDARLRAGFADFYSQMAAMIDLWVKRDPRLIYDGLDLKTDMLAAYDREAKTCDLTYLNSAKQPVALSLLDMPARLYDISYDPYDCIELRWGARGEERKTCSNGERKNRWYEAQARLRHMKERATNTAYSLDDLESRPPRDSAPPPVDVRALITAMPARIPLAPMQPVGR